MPTWLYSPLIGTLDTCPQVAFTEIIVRVFVISGEGKIPISGGDNEDISFICAWFKIILASSGQHLSGGRQLGARPRLCVSVHRGLCLLRGGGEAAAGDQVALHLLLVTPAGGDTAAEQRQHQGRGRHPVCHYLDTVLQQAAGAGAGLLMRGQFT